MIVTQSEFEALMHKGVDVPETTQISDAHTLPADVEVTIGGRLTFRNWTASTLFFRLNDPSGVIMVRIRKEDSRLRVSVPDAFVGQVHGMPVPWDVLKAVQLGAVLRVTGAVSKLTPRDDPATALDVYHIEIIEQAPIVAIEQEDLGQRPVAAADVQVVPNSPVFQGKSGRWWFYDETWANAIGPFAEKADAVLACQAYGAELNCPKPAVGQVWLVGSVTDALMSRASMIIDVGIYSDIQRVVLGCDTLFYGDVVFDPSVNPDRLVAAPEGHRTVQHWPPRGFNPGGRGELSKLIAGPGAPWSYPENVPRPLDEDIPKGS